MRISYFKRNFSEKIGMVSVSFLNSIQPIFSIYFHFHLWGGEIRWHTKSLYSKLLTKRAKFNVKNFYHYLSRFRFFSTMGYSRSRGTTFDTNMKTAKFSVKIFSRGWELFVIIKIITSSHVWTVFISVGSNEIYK